MVFYDGWKLSACILLSLFLQIFLVVAGSFRRLASRRWIVKIIWFAYLLAEFVAVFGLGLIVSRQSLLYNDYKDDIVQVRCMVHGVSDSCKDDHILMYWATFLLVHLGGPDTITAFATEDNELWLRNLFYLSSKCIAVAYAIYQSVETNYRVEVPILLLFLYGIIKCTERTCALYYGSAKSFRNSMLSKSNLGVNDFSKKEDTLLIKMNGEALFNIEVLQCASVFFMTFKGLVVDLSVGIHDLNQSRDFFLQRSSQDAFRLVEVELNYLYDVLFTKIPVLHSKLGLCGRTLSFMAVVSSLVVFYCDFGVKVVNYKIDLVLTYILYFGAIVLEVIAFYMLLFCDWTVVKLRLLSDANPNHKSWKDKFLDCILSVNNTRSAFYNSFLRLIGDRNHQRPNLLIEASFIFNELKMKSKIASNLAVAKEICTSKGEWVLNELGEDRGTFLPYVTNYKYDDILLLWHIATELCYNDIQDQVTNKELRDTAKQLSDYMLYLMIMKPEMMSAVSSIGETKFQDTCTEVSKYFQTKLPELEKRKFSTFFHRKSKEEKEPLQKKACETILRPKTEVDELVTVCRDKSLFFTASVLARELKDMPSERKWMIISKLWVELLSYAASHVRSSAHAEQLSKGGQLITVVWLLMAHFGLGDHYEIDL